MSNNNNTISDTTINLDELIEETTSDEVTEGEVQYGLRALVSSLYLR